MLWLSGKAFPITFHESQLVINESKGIQGKNMSLQNLNVFISNPFLTTPPTQATKT